MAAAAGEQTQASRKTRAGYEQAIASEMKGVVGVFLVPLFGSTAAFIGISFQ